ncbi:MAG TPA: M48 family metallopeptidase [Bryobacteraceae bacterium]|nr:M48 family metallopeptidase [Bryobacteraceae bacterium]
MKLLPALLCAALLSAAYAADGKKDDPAQIGNRDVGKGVNLYSVEKEMALGRQLAQEVQRQTPMVTDPLIAEFVNRMGQNLVRHSDVRIPVTFYVIDSASLNAFALPGGHVFVSAGLMEIADDEAELAGAMAHEIAHVAARHLTRQASRQQIAGMAAAPVGAALGGWTGYAARQGSSLGIPMTFLTFGRRDEAEADYLGVQYAYAAGYDPSGVISMFEKLESLQKKQPGAVSKAFSTHPPDADRIRKTQEEIDKILPARTDYVVTTSEYREIRKRLIDQRAAREEQAAKP